MGLSLHYSGRLSHPDLLAPLIEEVQDIARIYKWPFTIHHTEFPTGSFQNEAHDNRLYGISFTPPDCETVPICFLSNGSMSAASLLRFYGHSTDEEEKKYLYMISVKTQFAGWQIHALIVGLLKYLSKKYFSQFEVSDEGLYWETGDTTILQQTFSGYTALLESVSTAFESFPVQEGETMKAYIERMMGFVKKKFEDD